MLETNNFAAWRPDHIMIHRNKGNQLKGEHEIAVIGDFSLEPQHNSSIYDVKEDGIVRTPSDHFGLFAKISLE